MVHPATAAEMGTYGAAPKAYRRATRTYGVGISLIPTATYPTGITNRTPPTIMAPQTTTLPAIIAPPTTTILGGTLGETTMVHGEAAMAHGEIVIAPGVTMVHGETTTVTTPGTTMTVAAVTTLGITTTTTTLGG